MAPVFWLEISDWKKENAQVNVSKPNIYQYFSSRGKRTKYEGNSLNSLKYFHDGADLNFNKLKEKFNLFSEKIIVFNHNDHFKLFSKYLSSFTYEERDFVTSRSVVSRIMNTPFEINDNKRKWIIKAKIINGEGIYLYYDNEDNASVQMCKHFELLKRHLFVKQPIAYYRNITSAFNEIFVEFNYLLELGGCDLYYLTEIAGVISEHQITTIEELRTTEHVYCDIYEADEFSQDVINYNPIWWSKAVLMNAKQCILASYDKDKDCIKEIHKFNINKFDDKTKYENLWSPDAAWNFLNNFINFVKYSVNSVSNDVKKKCVWKFQSFQNDDPLVTCEILFAKVENGEETLTPLSVDLINF